MESTFLLPMGADANYTTVSGWSGGAFMADNLNVIYSDTVKGVGMNAGGPYNSADYYDYAGLWDFTGFIDTEYAATESISRANSNQALGLIDDQSSQENKPVYIFESLMDE